ncbi:MAG TPA: TIGR01777 family oxidoreductase [Streptosporangiaceae bacterium]|nr:TIGR01777 family oxidoreductase [Streptosporangiaceae bacterium]
MTHTFSYVVDAPLDEVFAWYARPGAIVRLTPPWLPIRVAKEAASLRDGRAVLALPGGLRWVAQHDPAAYDPPRRFADALTSMPLRAALPWRHVHEFAAVAPSTTRVTDRVATPIRAGLVRPMMGYRYRQLAGDLAAHRCAWQCRSEPLTVAITGSSGLIGSALTAFLTSGGHRVIRLVRRAPAGDGERRWDPEDPDPGLLRGTNALVHLAGASIAGRFSADHKRSIRASRITPTRRLAELAAATSGGPAVMVAASAIGYYGPDRGDELLTEDSPRGDGFLADVVADWEAASTPASDAGLRLVLIRTGIVQSPRGGTLRLLWPLAEVGAGGRLGSGHQWVSWIGIDDLADIYYRALIDDTLAGPVNATSPHPVRGAEYAGVLAHVLRRPLQLPVPALGPRLLLGEQGASELAEADQRVSPRRLLRSGHRFRHPQLEQALRHLLGRAQPGCSAPYPHRPS